MANFNQCNSVADRWEKEVFIIALNQDKLVSGYKWNNVKRPEYDLKLLLNPNGEIITIEVKAQSIYNKNDPDNDWFVIETQQGGQPSGLSLTTADYYYIFKYNKTDQDLLTKIYFNKTTNGSAENGVAYTLYKIKTDVIHDIINNNPNLPTSTFNDCRRGGNNISYKINMTYFNGLSKSNFRSMTGTLDNDELIDLDDNHMVRIPNIPDRIYYADNPDELEEEEDDDMLLPKKGKGYDSDSSGSNSSGYSDNGLEFLKFISKK